MPPRSAVPFLGPRHIETGAQDRRGEEDAGADAAIEALDRQLRA